MDRAGPSALTPAQALLPPAQEVSRRGGRGARPEQSGRSTDPTGPPIAVDTPGERTYVTARGQVTTGMPPAGRRSQPTVPSPGATPRRTS